jgi:hypothetical protein
MTFISFFRLSGRYEEKYEVIAKLGKVLNLVIFKLYLEKILSLNLIKASSKPSISDFKYLIVSFF